MPINSAAIAMFKTLPGVSCVEYEEPMLFFQLHNVDYTITIPDRYPNASAEYYGPDGAHGQLSAGTLDVMAQQFLSQISSGGGSRNPGTNEEDIDDTMDSPETTADMHDGDLMSRQDSSGGTSPELDADIQKLKARTDVFNVTVRMYTAGSMHIAWKMNVKDLVSQTVASAWGIDTAVPIEVTAKVWSYYMDATQAPTVDLFQRGKRFPFGQQMSRILRTHIQDYWPRNFPTEVNVNVNAVKVQPTQGGGGGKLTSAQNTVMNQLCGMGFPADASKRAAVNAANLDSAIEFITSGRCNNNVVTTSVELKDSAAAGQAFSNPDSTRYDSATDTNKVCPLIVKQGFLSHIVDVLNKRTATISKYCVLCDKPHVFATNMLRPAVCSRDICVFQFQELRLGSDSAESVATDAGVVDLLLTIFRNAALSQRAASILLPFPSVAHPKDKKKLILDPAKPDIDAVRNVLKSFPTTKDVVRCNDLSELKERLERTEPLAYPLLEWVIASNRSHLIQMDASALIAGMDTPHQFLLLTAAPEREAIFRARKEKHGTKFAFHGSRGENWHNILRNGLKNMSGTSNQLNGSAHGSGVYFAPAASHSFGYSNAAAAVDSHGGAREFLGDSMCCIALCEIIDDGSIKDHGWCWTVTEEANIMTRFFFAYPTAPTQTAMQAQTPKSEFMDQVYKAMRFYAL